MPDVRRWRRIAASALVFVLAAASAEAAATHRHYGTPTLDGLEGASEWTGADFGTASMTFPAALGGGTFPVTFYVMSDELKVYTAVRIPYGSSPVAPASIGTSAYAATFDFEACPPSPDDIVDFFQVSSQGNNAFSYDSYIADGCTVNELFDADTTDGGTMDTDGTWAISLSSTFMEMSHPLDDGDDAHDINRPAPGWIWLRTLAGACDGTVGGCGPPAIVLRKVYLPADGLILFDDFESNDMSFWSSHLP